MPRCAPRLPIHPLALAIALGLSGLAHAQSTQTAQASYVDGSGTTVSLQAGPSPDGVDVLQFTGFYSGGTYSDVGIHTYGNPTGEFGSRSSGSGYFDVTGLFTIAKQVTNTSAIAQRVTFNFNITPGLLGNDIYSNLREGEYVSAGLAFDIRSNGAQVWSSAATLKTDMNGTTYNQTGADLYARSSTTQVAVVGGDFSVDLGVLQAGESLDLHYTLGTFAQGNAPAHPGEVVTVPEQVVTVPDRTAFIPERTYQVWQYNDGTYGGYGYPVAAAMAYGGDYGGGYGGDYGGTWCGGGYYTAGSGSCMDRTEPAHTEIIPGYSYTIGGYTLTGNPSGAHASSGDPFELDFGPYGLPYAQTSVTLSSPVPEPGSIGLTLGGLAVVGAVMARRRRQPA